MYQKIKQKLQAFDAKMKNPISGWATVAVAIGFCSVFYSVLVSVLLILLGGK
ncbi:MAG: hypothetical protein LBP62_03180 [Clostridiales bacterium]|jgi:hypothetical protein|nr:hypothetical protein [Clostridiales bacterium]